MLEAVLIMHSTAIVVLSFAVVMNSRTLRSQGLAILVARQDSERAAGQPPKGE